MSLTLDDINNLSNLARITLSGEEAQEVLEDLSSVLGYVSEVNQIANEDITKTHEHINITRQDEIKNTVAEYTEGILANAPKTHKGYIQVDQVL